MAKKRGKEKPEEVTAAVQITGEEHSVVGIWNLRVVVIQEGVHWFAQGLDIDYAAQGDSIQDAQDKFRDGLAATIHEHLKVHGTIENILQVAPQSVWRDLLWHPTAQGKKFTQLTVHPIQKQYLPFGQIEYLQLAS